MGDIFILQPGSKYNDGILLDYYEGEYSLVRARRGSNGTVYKSWCYPQNKDRAPGAKAIPWKVPIGNKETALDILDQIAKALRGEDIETPPPVQGDVPF